MNKQLYSSFDKSTANHVEHLQTKRLIKKQGITENVLMLQMNLKYYI